MYFQSQFWFVLTLSEKCPNTDFFTGLYFPALGVNTEIYSMNLRI